MLSGPIVLFVFTCKSFLQTTWECTIGTSSAGGKMMGGMTYQVAEDQQLRLRSTDLEAQQVRLRTAQRRRARG